MYLSPPNATPEREPSPLAQNSFKIIHPQRRYFSIIISWKINKTLFSRKNSVEISPVEKILSLLAYQLSKLFNSSFCVRNLYVEKIQPPMKATLDFFECRKFSQGKKEFINFFRMSKRFHIFWKISWKHFECRKKSTSFLMVLKVWNLFDIVSERLNFFEFGVAFLRHHFLLSKFFCRNSCSRKYYAMKCRKNSVVKKSPCRKNSVEINTV